LQLPNTSTDLYKKHIRRVWHIRWKRVYKKLKIKNITRSIRSFAINSGFFINQNHLTFRKKKHNIKFKLIGRELNLAKNFSKFNYIKFKDNNVVAVNNLQRLFLFNNRSRGNNLPAQL
jgi:hypothetical protein